MERFEQRKKSILEKADKSSKGSWDERIVPLCDKLNELKDYYTTSSCSGRIVVIKDVEEKIRDIFEFVSHDKVDLKNFLEKVGNLNGNFKFKQDPFILHVACRDLEAAQRLLSKGLEAGIKRCGVISLGENVVVELNSTEKLEFPLIKEGKLLVGEEFLGEVLEKANHNLEKGWKKIEKLRKIL